VSRETKHACGDECQEALTQLEAFLDGELPTTKVESMRHHLQECYPCTDRASFEEQLRSIVRRGCADVAPAHLVDRIREHLVTGPGEA